MELSRRANPAYLLHPTQRTKHPKTPMAESVTPAAAAEHFEVFRLFLESLFRNPKYLNESDVVLITNNLVPVVDYVQQHIPEGVSQLRSMLFGRGGQFQVKIQVVDGELQLLLNDFQGDLLLGMNFPREMALNIAASILSHKEPEEVPLEKRN